MFLRKKYNTIDWWLLFSSLLVFFITVKTDDFSFGQERDKLKLCIEDYLLKDPDLRIGNSAANISQMVAKRFSYKSFTVKQFIKAVDNIYYLLKGKTFLFNDNNISEQLRVSIKKALQFCVERKNLPNLMYETQILADLLDYILVDWQTTLKEMISTHHGRSTLRLYAYSAGLRLMSALSHYSMNFEVFHQELRKIWILRARQFYDGRGFGTPYIRHRFTTDRDRMYSSILLEDVHTIDNINLFILRGSENFSHRNPTLNRGNGNQDLSLSCRRNDSSPESSSYISGADYYLETHINRCYRVILYILELQLRGISSEEDDIYDGPIPADVMPLAIQEMIWNSARYQNYLMAWYDHLKSSLNSEIKECFFKEDLIMLLSLLITQKSSKTITTTTTTTTASTTSTESSDNENGSKKGGVRSKDCGKYFLSNKRFRSNSNEQNQQQSGRMDTNFQSYGFIEYVGEPTQLMLQEEDRLILPKCFEESTFLMREFAMRNNYELSFA